MRLMVCLHDNPLNGQEFEPLLPLLKERGIQAVVHKRPIKGSKLEPLLQSIHATAKVSGGGSFGLIAYSWGAYLALAYLKQFPENVTSLVLLNPQLVAEKRPEQILLATPLLRTLVLKWRCRSLASGFVSRTFAPDFPPAETRAGMESFLAQAQVWKGEAAYQELLKEKPLSTDFSGIQIPVKALFGKQDCVAPIEAQLPILEKLPRLDAVLVPDAGHALPWTHSTLVADIVQRLR
ncbi:MAG: alpha/beta hydrolase [Parachlamydia sp.]|nr:alpha/beta hydrolase [Parachlamydia sp.]